MINEVNKFGLSKRDMNTINAIFGKFPEIIQVNIFGSRALDRYKPGSDIDLAIMNELPEKTLGRLQADFDESSLPYHVDMIVYPSLQHEELKEHIQRVGVLFYKKVKPTSSS